MTFPMGRLRTLPRAVSTCAASPTVTESNWSHSAPQPFPWSETSSSIALRSTGCSKPVDTFRSMQEPRRTQTVSRSRIKVPKLHWTSPRASAAALAWQPAPNGAAHLFTGSKLTHLSLVTQGRNERGKRARAMSHQMEADFGPCSTYGECAQVCPAEIPLTAIAAVNKESMRFGLRRKDN